MKKGIKNYVVWNLAVLGLIFIANLLRTGEQNILNDIGLAAGAGLLGFFSRLFEKQGDKHNDNLAVLLCILFALIALFFALCATLVPTAAGWGNSQSIISNLLYYTALIVLVYSYLSLSLGEKEKT